MEVSRDRQHQTLTSPEHETENDMSESETMIHLQQSPSSDAHQLQQYDGFPDYYLSQALSNDRSSQYQGDRGIDRIVSIVSIGHRINTKLSQFSHPLSKAQTSYNVIVDFNGPDDQLRPKTWPRGKKVLTTLLYGCVTLGSTFNSSIYSSATTDISKEFHVSPLVATLGITLFLCGYGTGPMLWAPLSEVYGRRAAVLPPYFISIAFTFGSATAKDFQTLMICRFFCGFFGSAPVTNTGGVLNDLWLPQERGAMMGVYSMAVTGGPLIAPVIGGAIVDSYLSWRWCFYIAGILASLMMVLATLLGDETYENTLLVCKARRLRHDTGNWALHARHEEWDVSFSALTHKYLVRPFQLLFTPIAFCMAVYASLVYGVLYMSFASFAIQFQEERGWNSLVGSLPFLSTFLGAAAGVMTNVLNTKYYNSRLDANGGRPVPEARLPPMMVGAVVFPAGQFLFGWTSSREVFWFPAVVGCFMIGYGFVTIFQCALNYLIDTFQRYAASAVAGNTALRSVVAAALPLVALPMFHNLGIPWASSLIGFIGVLMMPIPYLFFIYGEKIRAKGKWSLDSVGP